MIRIVVLLTCLSLLKINISAQEAPVQWKFGRTSSPGSIRIMQTDSMGFLYIAGVFSSAEFNVGSKTVPGFRQTEEYNTFLLKLSPVGKLVWLHSAYGSLAGSQVEPLEFSINNRGELSAVIEAKQTDKITIGAKTFVIDSSIGSTIVCKISKTGRMEWVYSINAIRDTLPELVNTDLFLDDAGDTYLTGYFQGNRAQIGNEFINGLTNDLLLYLAKINPDGTINWFKANEFDPSGDNGFVKGVKLANASPDAFYLTGTYSGYRPLIFGTDTLENPMSTDIFLAKYNKDGTAQWGIPIQSDGFDSPDDIRLFNNGDILLAGHFNGYTINILGKDLSNYSLLYNVFLAKLNSNGEYIESTTFSSELYGIDEINPDLFLNINRSNDITICSEFRSSSVFTNGEQLDNIDPGTSDVVFAKLSGADLLPVWSRQMSAPGDNSIDAAHIDRLGNLFIGGTSYNELNVSTEVIPINTEGTPYLVKLAPDGNLDYLYTQNNSVNAQLRVTSISSDLFGNAYAGGIYYGPASALDNIAIGENGDEGLFFGKYAYTSSISGKVFNEESNPLASGMVKIYGCTQLQRAPIADSANIQPDGSFSFIDFPYGNYLMVAIPENKENNPYIETYYPSEEYWEFAGNVKINTPGEMSNMNIVLQYQSQFSGGGRATGNLSAEDDLKAAYSDGYSVQARPSKKSKVILAGNKKNKSTYEVLATTETDEEGNFEFTGIEDGTYYVWVDIPGLPTQYVHIIEISGGNYISNINYLETEETVEGIGVPTINKVPGEIDPEGFKLYPVPANEYIVVHWEGMEQGLLDIFDTRGSHIKQHPLNQEFNYLNITKLPEGNYLIRIMTNNDILFRKISVVR